MPRRFRSRPATSGSPLTSNHLQWLVIPTCERASAAIDSRVGKLSPVLDVERLYTSSYRSAYLSSCPLCAEMCQLELKLGGKIHKGTRNPDSDRQQHAQVGTGHRGSEVRCQSERRLSRVGRARGGECSSGEHETTFRCSARSALHRSHDPYDRHWYHVELQRGNWSRSTAPGTLV